MDKFQILCRTKAEQHDVLERLEEMGFKWFVSGMKPLEKEKYKALYKTPMTIQVDRKEKCVTQSRDGSGFCSICGKVIDAAEFLLGNEIRIYRNGNTITAVSMANKKTGVAKCSPEDEFNFFFGVKLALKRLEVKLKNPEEEFNGKVVCIDIDTELSADFTKGKIYTIKDGRIKSDCGVGFMVEDIEDLNSLFPWISFVEVIE